MKMYSLKRSIQAFQLLHPTAYYLLINNRIDTRHTNIGKEFFFIHSFTNGYRYNFTFQFLRAKG